MSLHEYLKRITAIMITIAAAMAICLAAAPSFAANEEITYHETEEEAAAELRDHMKHREQKVSIGLQCETDSEGLEDLIGDLIDKALEHTGEPDEGDYIAFQYSGYKGLAKTGYSGTTPVVEVEYELAYYDDADQEAEVDKKAEEIIEDLDLEDKTEYQKINAIYNYICNHVEYEQDEEGSNIRHTAYGALIEGKAVCQGYSVSLYRLLLEAGIDNRIIFGESKQSEGPSNAHTWNIVRLKDVYYYLDATWDDSSFSRKYCLIPTGTNFEDEHIADKRYKDESFAEKYPMADEEYEGDRSEAMKRVASLARSFIDFVRDLLSKENG